MNDELLTKGIIPRFTLKNVASKQRSDVHCLIYQLTKYVLPRNEDFLLSDILVTFLPFIIALLTALRKTRRLFICGEDMTIVNY